MFVPHASEIWRKSYGPNLQNFKPFYREPGFFKTIVDKALTFWKACLYLKQLFKAKD